MNGLRQPLEIGETERRKRLAAVYNLLLDLAAKKRAREAAAQLDAAATPSGDDESSHA